MDSNKHNRLKRGVLREIGYLVLTFDGFQLKRRFQCGKTVYFIQQQSAVLDYCTPQPSRSRRGRTGRQPSSSRRCNVGDGSDAVTPHCSSQPWYFNKFIVLSHSWLYDSIKPLLALYDSIKPLF